MEVMDEKQRNDALTEATCRIIEAGGRIYLRAEDGWYVGCWSNLAGGEDHVHWSSRAGALEIGDLRTAHALVGIFSRRKVRVSVALPGRPA